MPFFVVVGYGMTECLVTHIATGDYHKYGSVGKLLPMTECKVSSPICVGISIFPMKFATL